MPSGPEPPQQLGVASQQRRHEHDEQHQQHRLDRHQRDHLRPPSSRELLPQPFQAGVVVSARPVVDHLGAVAVHRRHRGGVPAHDQPADDLGLAGDLGVALPVTKLIAVDRAVPQSPWAHWQPPGNTVPGIRLQSM